MQPFAGNELLSMEKNIYLKSFQNAMRLFLFYQAQLISDFENWWIPSGSLTRLCRDICKINQVLESNSGNLHYFFPFSIFFKAKFCLAIKEQSKLSFLEAYCFLGSQNTASSYETCLKDDSIINSQDPKTGKLNN